MHRFIVRWRFLALVAPVMAALAFVLFGGGGGGTTRSLATGPTPGALPNLTGVSCSDIYLDSGGTPADVDSDGDPGAFVDDHITSLTMTRIEPHGGTTVSTSWDVSTVSYLGKAGPSGLVPGGPPGPSCGSTTAAAAGAAEANRFGGPFQVAYGNQYGIRPTAVATYTPRGDGTGDLSFKTCGYSETESAWVRVDSTTHIVKTGPGTVNDGSGTLYLGTSAPTAGLIDANGDGVYDTTSSPTTCDTTVAGIVSYNFISKNYSRDARTSHTAASDAACGTDTTCLRNRALLIPADPDNLTLKTKSTVVNPDGNDHLADNWSGDGCTDWDKLGNGFMHTTPAAPPLLYPPNYTWANTPVNGMDPFNPYDCDSNWTSTISMTTTIIHNKNGAANGNPAIGCTGIQVVVHTCPNGDGQYFRCLGTFSQNKGGAPTQALSYRLGCYSDSTATAVNASYPAPDNACPVGCGDGKAGQPPAGCLPNTADPSWCANATAPNCPSLPCPASRFVYTGIDPATYPVVANDPANNYYDPATNTIHLGGCFAGFGGVAFGNVFGSAVIDAHTGAGSFAIYINQAANCAGSPTGSAIPGQIEIVELRTEKTAAGPLPDNQKYDSDGDGCADARELGSSATTGGLRDPYNPWDFFNPEKVNTPDTQTVSDIIKVVQQFGKDQGNVAYTTATDRTAVPGGQAWSLGAPDGKQSVADILAAVKQFGQNCPHVTP
jgi:hypothetical protein